MADDLQDLVGHALALHQRGMLADAERLYLDVLRVQPDNADVLQLAGVLALQTGRAAQGVALIYRALQAGHRSAAAFSNLGEGLRALGRPEEALACYDRAIALQPDGPAAHYNRGNVLADLRRHEAALASYERAICNEAGLFQGACKSRQGAGGSTALCGGAGKLRHGDRIQAGLRPGALQSWRGFGVSWPE